MRPIIQLCFAQLRKDKIQKLLITVILLLSVLLFTTALSVIRNTENLYTKMHDQVKGAHQILQFENGFHDPVEVKNWWLKQEGVVTSQVMPYKKISNITTDNNDKIMNYTAYMMRTPLEPLVIDRLQVSDGKIENQPTQGSIWVPTAFALTNQIKVGDTLQFTQDDHQFSLQIEAIIVDISYCAPFSTSGRFYMNYTDYDTIFLKSKMDFSMISLRFDNYEDNQKYWQQFVKDFKTPYLETITEFESLSAFYFLTNKMIGFIMLFLALVMLMIALFTIGYNISNSIITNYRTIGITQSLGFSAKKTMMTYMFLYSLLSITALIPGIMVSYFVSRIIALNAFQYLKTNQLLEQFSFANLAIIIAIFMPILVLTIVFIYASKAIKIKPAQAIRYGMDEKEIVKRGARYHALDKRKGLLGSIPITIYLALSNIVKNKKVTVMIFFLCTVTFSVLVFCTIFVSSIIRMQESIGEWGYDTSDVVIVAKDDGVINQKNLQEALRENTDIDCINFYGDMNVIVTGDDEVPPMGMVLSVVQGSYDEIGFTTLQGRNPSNDNEISIGVNLARKYKIDIGDTIDLYIKGRKVTFLVTGTYQAIANMAFTARITINGAQKADSEYNDHTTVFIKMKSSKNVKAFVERFNQQFKGNMKAISSTVLVKGVIDEVISTLSLPVLMMTTIFLIVIFVILYCMGNIMTKKHQMTYGIYKSLGMTSANIRKSISFSTLIIALNSVWVGIIIGTIVIPKLINVVLANYGIIKMPFVYNFLIVFGVALVGALTATWGSWASAKVVKKMSPKILIVE